MHELTSWDFLLPAWIDNFYEPPSLAEAMMVAVCLSMGHVGEV